MSGPSAERNLLFGILALQLDFIDRDALIKAMQAWVLDKAKPLGEILVGQAALLPERRTLIDALVDEHLRQHDHDAQKSLAALSSIDSARAELERIPDAEVQASLVQVSAARGADPYATRASSVGESSAAGTRFRILRPHARGGLGEVFVAEDSELHREIALKQIQDRHADDANSRSRFVLEAEITGGLEHPGIVPVYGLGQYADGRPFYAMRFIRGDSLKDAIERFHGSAAAKLDPGQRTIEFRKLLGRFLDVCNAIAYAHSRGVLHRDLKPGNIMLGKYGETLVVDWGLAKPIGARDAPVVDEAPLQPSGQSGTAETIAGSAIGTPQFMSPEQAAGRLDLIGPASDVYSLGATLYTLLTGKVPFPATDVGEVLRQVQRGDFLPPRQVLAEIPPALEAVCLKAMACAPAERYESPRSLADDVEKWLADEPVSVYREPWTGRLQRWVRHHRGQVMAASAALAVLVTVAIAWALVADARVREQEQSAVAHEMTTLRDRAESALDQLNATQQRLALLTYADRVSLAQSRWRSGHVVLTRRLLDESQAVPGEAELQGWEWGYVDRLTHRARSVLAGHTERVLGVAYSPDGKYLASSSKDHSVRLWDARTGAARGVLAGDTKAATAIAWSPDGRTLASALDDHSICLWDVATAKKKALLEGHQSLVSDLAWSPDGRSLASASGDKTVRTWDPDTARERKVLRGHTDGASKVVWSPDGRRLASFSSDKTVRLWDAASGREQATLKGHTIWINDMKWSPAGDRVASASHDNTIRLWDTTTGEPLKVIELEAPNDCLSIAWSPDGRRLAGGSANGKLMLWDNSGKQLAALEGHTGLIFQVAWSPDGRRLATAGDDKSIRLWDGIMGRELAVLRGHTSLVYRVCWRPDGRQLASTSLEATLRTWAVASSKELAVLQGPKHGVSAVAWSPDGRRLAASSTDSTIHVWDAHTSRSAAVLRGHTSQVNHVAWGPDGDRLASASSDGTVRLWEVQTGKVLAICPGHEQSVLGVAFRPDGLQLVSWSYDHTLRLWDTSGKSVAVLNGHSDCVWHASFSPDGTRVASAADDHTVRIWDTATGQQRAVLRQHTHWVKHVTWSPAGDRIASASSDNTVRLWDANSGAELAVLRGHHNFVKRVFWRPDGQMLASASADYSIRLWDSATGKELNVLLGHSGSVDDLDWSSDGRRLASASLDKTVRLWDTVTGKELAVLQHPLAAERVAWSPDGQRIASAYSGDSSVRVWIAQETADERQQRDEVAWLNVISRDEEDGAWASAAFHIARLPGAANSSALQERLGRALAEQGKWSEAAAAYECSLRLARVRSLETWTLYALAQLAAGDEAAYREACVAMLDALQETKDSRAADRVASLIALRLAAVDAAERKRALALIKRALDSEPESWFYLSTAGALHYRAGNHDTARQLLDRAAKLRGNPGPTVWILQFLAMSHHQLGNKDLAKSLLEKAGKQARADQQPKNRQHWAPRLGQQLLQREAQKLLAEP